MTDAFRWRKNVSPVFIVVAAVLAVETAWLYSAAGLAGNRPLLRRFEIPLDRVAQVSQTMRIDAPGFQSIAIIGRAVGDRVDGQLRVQLVDVAETGEQTVVDRVVSAADLTSRSPYSVAFVADDRSRGHAYRLDVTPLPATVGVVLQASRGTGEPSGALHINGTERWGDLVFQTDATGARLVDRIGARLFAASPALPALAAAIALALHIGIALLIVAVRRTVAVEPRTSNLAP